MGQKRGRGKYFYFLLKKLSSIFEGRAGECVSFFFSFHNCSLSFLQNKKLQSTSTNRVVVWAQLTHSAAVTGLII